MAGPRNERDRGSDEDLFEDLDQFFAPLEEGEWPPEGEAETPSERPPAEGGPGSDAPDQEADLDAIEIDIPDEAELVGPPPAPKGEARPEDQPSAPEAAEPPAEEPPAEEDLVEEPAPEEERAGEEEPAAEEPSVAGEEPSVAGGEPPLTVDDLRAAPPEYADLPAPPEDQPVLAGEASIESLEDLEDVPPSEEEEVVAEAGPPAAGEPEEEMAAAEAAADHFAEGIAPEEVERELLSDLDQTGDQTVRIAPEGTGAPAPTPEPPEGIVAPTWEEEGAHRVLPEEEVEPEAERRPARGLAAGRNLTAAIISGALLAAAVIALLVIGKGPFVVFAALAVLLGQAEFYAVMRARGYRPATLLGLVVGAITIAGAYLQGDAAVLFGVSLTMALSVLWYMAAPAPARKQLTTDAAATVLGVMYVPVLASFAILLLALPGDIGRNVFLTVVGLTILYDVCAYAVGTMWGNRPLAPTISPGKSWEGAIGATLLVLVVALLIVPSIDPFTASTSVGLALLIAVAAPLGDLVESAFKRDMGVKDMGSLLPGHGGMLDRIDAILFTAPVAYYFLRIAFL